MYRTRRRPLGHSTRGKTAPNRLRRLDALVCALYPGLIRAPGPGVFLDLGYGREPRTTLESAGRLRALNPCLEVVGAEIDRGRVAAARPFEDARTRFVRGGFEVDVGPVRLLRAMNVLRQYEEAAVPEAWAALGRRVVEGGLVIEGTCSPYGRWLTANLLRRRGGGLVLEGVLFSTNFKEDFHPGRFQPVLPKSLIHRVLPGQPVHTFFRRWTAAWHLAQPWGSYGPRALFRETARRLEVPLDRRRWLAPRGYLIWRPSDRTYSPR